MLSEIEKNKIREESLFRHQVSAEIESANKSPRSQRKVWLFLNSSFALWLLSTVGVGLVTWLYTTLKVREEKISHDLRIERRLKLELDNRLQNTNLYLGSLKFTMDSTQFYSLGGIARRTLKKLDSVDTKYVFEEFRQVNYLSLLYELKGVSAKEDTKEIDKSIAAYRKLFDISLKHYAIVDNNYILSPAEVQMVQKDINHIGYIINTETRVVE